MRARGHNHNNNNDNDATTNGASNAVHTWSDLRVLHENSPNAARARNSNSMLLATNTRTGIPSPFDDTSFNGPAASASLSSAASALFSRRQKRNRKSSVSLFSSTNTNANANANHGWNATTANTNESQSSTLLNGKIKETNGSSSSNNSNSNSNYSIINSNNEEAPTAPEVNKWTTIMTDPDAFNNANANLDLTTGSTTKPNDIHTSLSLLTKQDLAQVETYWDTLMPHVSYLGTENASKVKQALKVAYTAHKGQVRKSGEPFIIHPVEVSILLAGLKMDAETVMSGLLHDTVEDTDLTFCEIEKLFGNIVKTIVEGETKVSKLPRLAFEDYADEQAENLRQMFVAMTDDYRIIIVKLADRMHNMRTLRYMKPEKQIKISRETLDIFAPLAHRMGIWQFKSELEDTSFMYLYPKEYKQLNRRLRRHQTKFRETLDRSQEILKKTLNNNPTLMEQAVEVRVSGRTKELYSLWHKMETKGEHNLDHITDVVALRVIIEPKRDSKDGNVVDSDVGVWLCYHVLGLVQHLPGFQPVPTKVKDYISFPKPNGYQSLHTSLMLNGQTIEVQIRTSAMHQIAENGMASHWAYTDGKKRADVGNKAAGELYNTPWLSSIKEWQDEALCSRDFVDCVRRELLGKRVFVFLRNGKILNLAKGATVIDAAFQIHTEVGLTMHGVEINGKPVPFAYELNNGDVVSVLTGKGKPATDWMRFAKIRSTRSKLRSYFRRKQKESLRDAGAILLMDFLCMYKELIEESSYLEESFEVPTTPEEIANFLPGHSQYNDVDDLLTDIGDSHDRDFLRTAVAKIFLVPQKSLVNAENGRQDYLSNQMLTEVNKKRQNARDVGTALDDDGDDFILDDLSAKKDGSNLLQSPPLIPPSRSSASSMGEQVFNGNSKPINGDSISSKNKVEIADPDHLCEECLPILGDEIIGTRPIGKANDFVTIVHRCGCPIAQKAAHSKQSSLTDDGQKKSKLSRLKARLGKKVEKISESGKSSQNNETLEVVQMKWDKSYYEGEDILYLTELSVVAKDRKYLLADCGEVVSDMSEIVRTGSLSTKEHAIFEFMVKVESLDHLQKLMDTLTEINSVMSVERKFGSFR